MRLILILAVVGSLNCLGQDLISNDQTNDVAAKKILQTTRQGHWLNYATNNPYIKGLIQQKREIDYKIDALQKQRLQFIALDHYNTYTNTPFLIMDESGHSKAYPSREAYDDEIIGGLIKSSLKINNEIIKQKELYFAAYESKTAVPSETNLRPPLELKVNP